MDSDEKKAQYFECVKQLRTKIDKTIDNFDENGAFMKLNWKAPLDGYWMNCNL